MWCFPWLSSLTPWLFSHTCACHSDPCPAIVPLHQVSPWQMDQAIRLQGHLTTSLSQSGVSGSSLPLILQSPPSQHSFLYSAAMTCFILQSEIHSPKLPSTQDTHKHKPSSLSCVCFSIFNHYENTKIKINKGKIENSKRLLLLQIP